MQKKIIKIDNRMLLRMANYLNAKELKIFEGLGMLDKKDIPKAKVVSDVKKRKQA